MNKIMDPKSRYLVFTSAGDNANINQWLVGDKNFDLWITYYGDQNERYSELADHYTKSKGAKFPNFYSIYKQYKDILELYEAIFIMDDDLYIDASSISRLFKIRDEHDLWLLQPAFNPLGKISHKVTEAQLLSHLRYTNFVEVTCPLFKRDMLFKFLDVYDPVLVGFGVDFWVTETLGPDLNGRIAIVDSITCLNPHDRKKGGNREIDALQTTEVRRQVWKEIKKKHHITSEERGIEEYGKIRQDVTVKNTFRSIFLASAKLREYIRSTLRKIIKGR